MPQCRSLRLATRCAQFLSVAILVCAWPCKGRRPQIPIGSVNRFSKGFGGVYLQNCSMSALRRLDIDLPYCRQLKGYARRTISGAYNQISAMTMGSWHQARLSFEAVSNMNGAGVDGDIVELGVWRGGMSALMMFSNLKADLSRHFWLYDTFDGMPPPDDKDDAFSHEAWNEFQSGERTSWVENGKWQYGSLDRVKRTVRGTGYPMEKIHFVKGRVEDTLRPGLDMPGRIAVLRIDTNFYSSTKAILQALWGRVSPCGMMIVDDYFQYGGQRDAMRDFFAGRHQLEELDSNERVMKDVFSAMLPNLVFFKNASVQLCHFEGVLGGLFAVSQGYQPL
ncbi:unnamed protein product [Polarella glacialis]|uniref:Macrocin O-methyltransferase n=1 Tax=Polarella glacialis TaxID=89957 RepID=A0A813HR06_POLGL|nr:unnamed protein product [Polarella glacialis]